MKTLLYNQTTMVENIFSSVSTVSTFILYFLYWACPTCSDFLSLVQGIMDLQELLAKMTAKVGI